MYHGGIQVVAPVVAAFLVGAAYIVAGPAVVPIQTNILLAPVGLIRVAVAKALDACTGAVDAVCMHSARVVALSAMVVIR